MADLARYGRRKQKNPQRKNVENEDNMGEATTLGSECKVDVKNDCSVNKSGLHCHDDKENCNHDTNHTISEEHNNNNNNNNNASQLKVKAQDSSPSSITVPGLVKEGSNASPVKESEEDKIKELLERSDTAVIFAEPVSDQEDDNGSHTGDSISNTDDEVCLKCAHCQQTFTHVYLLKEHMKTYHADKPIKYSCPKCEESFLLKSQLDKHLACHSPTSQLCRVCHKSFANVYRLQRHMISHDESTDLRKFKCPECGKAFKFKHHLKEHIRIHSGEKPFECTNCGKRFSHSGSYSSHMTSKKCWVMNMKGRRVDRNGNMEAISYANSPKQQPAITPTELPIQTNFPTQFVHFDPRNPTPAVPAYFSPSLNGNFIPYTIYSPKQKPSSVIYTSTPTRNGGRPQTQLSPDHKTEVMPSISDKTLVEAISKEIALVCSAESVRAVEKLKPEAVSPDSSMVQDDGNDGNSAERSEDGTTENQCKHCQSTFKSPVDLHQHERYLCKLNKDIIHRVSQMESGLNSPSSTTSSDFSKVDNSNGSIDGATDDEEVTDNKDDSLESRKLRMRSMITDEQLQVLKAHYQVNPRPRKFELIRIGNEIGFPKRVVQVWFQNMRARDRKKGKNVPYFPSMARFKRQEEGLSPSKVPSPYIPVVPQPYNGSMHPTTNVVLTTAGSFPVQDKFSGKYVQTATQSSPKPFCPSRQQEEPLDLTVRRTPPQAHSGSLPRSQTSSPPSDNDGEILNLSQKSSTQYKDLPLNIPVPRPRAETSLQDSAIYKYMQQEGMIHSHLSTIPNSMSNGHVSAAGSILTSCGLIAKSELQQNSPKLLSSTTGDEGEDKISASNLSQDEDGDTQGELVIDERTTEHTDDSESEERGRSKMEDERSGAEETDEDSEDEGEDDINKSLNPDDAHDPDRKSKRTRKKSWRQVEAEEFQLDLDESLSVDEDQPHRKKRRSWKNHKVDAEEGMYACDQCDKMFSKQSSLARHKYEHSGARPFNCDVCSKAFKHKHHLTEHKRLHSGEKPFQCRKCGKRFSHSGSYSQHMNHRYKYCKPNGGDEPESLLEGSEVKPCGRMLVYA